MSTEEKNHYVYTWRIKNYLSCYQTKGSCIKSPVFTVEDFSGSQWCLCLYPKGDNSLKKDEHFFGLFLDWKSLSEDLDEVIISYSLEALDEKGQVLKHNGLQNKKFDGNNTPWGWYKFYGNDDLEKQMSTWEEDVLTLRCQIKTEKHRKQKIVGCLAYTTYNVDRFCVDWHLLISSLQEYSESIAFPVSDLYSLEVTLKTVSEALEISVHYKEDKLKVPQQLTFTIIIFDRVGCRLGKKRVMHVYEEEETWTFPSFITKEMLRKCEKNSSQYEFKLHCEVCVSKKNISSSEIKTLKFASPPSVVSSPRDSPISTMQNQFRNIFISKNYSDITIRCMNEDFPAHKFVLRVRSPVFAAMFDQDMLENKTGVVFISDLDDKTMKAFLEYLYTETVENMDYDIATKLIMTADKYQVLSLVDKCASFLKMNVTVENVCEVISIADLLNCENLKSYSLNVIKVNAAKILPTAAWTQFIEGNIKLATYILCELSTTIVSEYKLI